MLIKPTAKDSKYCSIGLHYKMLAIFRMINQIYLARLSYCSIQSENQSECFSQLIKSCSCQYM